jgi:hypothetical protein
MFGHTSSEEQGHLAVTMAPSNGDAVAVVGRVVDVHATAWPPQVLVDIGEPGLVRFASPVPPLLCKGDLVVVQKLVDGQRLDRRAYRSVQRSPSLVLRAASWIGEQGDEVAVLPAHAHRVGDRLTDISSADVEVDRENKMLIVSVIPHAPIDPSAPVRKVEVQWQG